VHREGAGGTNVFYKITKPRADGDAYRSVKPDVNRQGDGGTNGEVSSTKALRIPLWSAARLSVSTPRGHDDADRIAAPVVHKEGACGTNGDVSSKNAITIPLFSATCLSVSTPRDDGDADHSVTPAVRREGVVGTKGEVLCKDVVNVWTPHGDGDAEWDSLALKNLELEAESVALREDAFMLRAQVAALRGQQKIIDLEVHDGVRSAEVSAVRPSLSPEVKRIIKEHRSSPMQQLVAGFHELLPASCRGTDFTVQCFSDSATCVPATTPLVDGDAEEDEEDSLALNLKLEAEHTMLQEDLLQLRAQVAALKCQQKKIDLQSFVHRFSAEGSAEDSTVRPSLSPEVKRIIKEHRSSPMQQCFAGLLELLPGSRDKR
jgi:hypothetical protein